MPEITQTMAEQPTAAAQNIPATPIPAPVTAGRIAGLIKMAAAFKAKNPGWAMILAGAVGSLAGGSYPAWLVPTLEVVGKGCLWLAQALQAVR